MKQKNNWSILLIFACTLLIVQSNICSSSSLLNSYSLKNPFKFNATQAYDFVQKQVDLGPRFPGSTGIEKTRHLVASELIPSGKWDIKYQNFSKIWNDQNVCLVNIICSPKSINSTQPFFLLMAHYDTRLWANEDPDPTKRRDPVLGANDGASGVAVALELGEVLLENYHYSNLKLVFFDGEDQGGIMGWDWLIGSSFFVESQEVKNQNLALAILFDMVAGNNATFKREKNSDKYAGELVTKIWNEGHEMGFNKYFINQTGRSIKDDHIPFIENNIPAVDIIDEFGIRFTPWHTTFDNMTYIDMKTIEAVGLTLESTLIELLTSEAWISNFSTVNFQTNFTILSLLNITALFTVVIIHCKNKLLYR
jgi:glutaminyl-peptide cyclotransferase